MRPIRKLKTKASPSTTPQKLRAYKIGKWKPPVDGQFQPGVSGNPNGRPPGRRKADPTFGDILGERVTITGPDGRTRSMSRREVIYRRLANKAVEGDHRSIMAVKDYDARRAAGEDNPDPLSLDPELTSSILEDFEQEVLDRAAQTRRAKRKKL